jgi:hypothetical protein
MGEERRRRKERRAESEGEKRQGGKRGEETHKISEWLSTAGKGLKFIPYTAVIVSFMVEGRSGRTHKVPSEKRER